MMFRRRSSGIRKLCVGFSCGLLILGFTACNLPGSVAGDEESTLAVGGADESELGQQQQALQKGECPRDELYDLANDHEMVMNTSEPGGDELHLEWHEAEGSDFSIWFNPSGTVTNEEFSDEITINVSGWVKTSNDECPINYIEGAWPLTAEIRGTCDKGIVKLHVTEEFKDVTLTGSCGGVAGPGPGLYSAPELDLPFDLSIPSTNDGIISGSRDSMLYFMYWYELRLPESLELVPLVPDS